MVYRLYTKYTFPIIALLLDSLYTELLFAYLCYDTNKKSKETNSQTLMIIIIYFCQQNYYLFIN